MVVRSDGIISAEQELPQLKFEWLPPKMGAFAKTLSESQQVEPSMAIMCCISVASACVVGKYQISEINSSWTEEWSSLYTVQIAPSGGRKSSVFNKAMKPIRDWETKEKTEMMPDFKKSLGTLKQKRKELDNLYKRADSVDEDTRNVALAELESGDLQKEVDQAEKDMPTLPHLIVNDATPEALEVRMAGHFGRVFSADSEGGALKNLGGSRWQTPPSFIPPLKAYSGDEILVDRVSRKLHIPQPAMTILWMVQPKLLTKLAKSEPMRDEGFWARFLFVVLPSVKHKLKPSNQAEAYAPKAVQEWTEVLCNLLGTSHKAESLEGHPVVHDMKLSKDADVIRDKYEKHILDAIQDGERLEKVDEWGLKAHGMAIRIASVLELFTEASKESVGVNLFKKEISKESMEWAVQIMKVLEDHYLHVMAPKESPEVKAQYVLGKLGELGGESSRRDLKMRCKEKWVENDASLEPYLALLEQTERITRTEKKHSNGVVSEIIKQT